MHSWPNFNNLRSYNGRVMFIINQIPFKICIVTKAPFKSIILKKLKKKKEKKKRKESYGHMD
jgi:hypothetical protein